MNSPHEQILSLAVGDNMRGAWTCGPDTLRDYERTPTVWVRARDGAMWTGSYICHPATDPMHVCSSYHQD